MKIKKNLGIQPTTFENIKSFDDAVDICFDISGHDGTVFNLLHEPISGLIINGEITDTVYKSHHAHRLAKIGIISPEGGMVAFNTTHIETFDSNGVNKLYTYASQGCTNRSSGRTRPKISGS